MSIREVTWEWFKTAPLPVVLSICLTSFTVLGTYAWSIDQEVKEQKTLVVVAAEKAKDAADTTRRVEAKIDKLAEMVQAVLVEQAVVRTEKKADNAVKKEKK